MCSFLFSSCSTNKIGLDSSFQYVSLKLLPVELQSDHLSFEKLLWFYDRLSDNQKIITLKHFLSQNNLSNKEQAEASYMLARLNQQSAQSGTAITKKMQEQALQLFDQAQTYPALNLKSLWHKSEIAATLGKEKLVRQTLSLILGLRNDTQQVAAAQYALAQSYLRSNETNTACSLFNKIRSNYPGTDYALGAGYYLGTIAYNQAENQCQSYYFEYLRLSPTGHFASDILKRLESPTAKKFLFCNTSEDYTTVANAYQSLSRYKKAVDWWNKVGIDKHPFPVAHCLLKLGQVGKAQAQFFRGLITDTKNSESLIVAQEIGSYLNKPSSLAFWQKLRKSNFLYQDTVLWNLANRTRTAECYTYYQELVKLFPSCNFAPEAQWRLVWIKIHTVRTKDLSSISDFCYRSAFKYSYSRVAPRFLFWSGKLREKMNDRPGAINRYEQTANLYALDYYGQRACTRLQVLNNSVQDNYFVPRANFYSKPQSWQWPSPEKDIEELQKQNPTAYELIYLKQYSEALPEIKDHHPKVMAWLYGKTGQPWLAINTAADYLKNTSQLNNADITWLQYSYPLLYNQTIAASCKNTDLSDPLLMHALIREESRYNPRAISQSNALGLCQLLASTAAGLAQKLHIKIAKTDQLFQDTVNIPLGALYLSSALKSFDNNGLFAVASYNAGINAVKSFLGSKKELYLAQPDDFVEEFPFQETRDYIRKVFASYWHYKMIYDKAGFS